MIRISHHTLHNTLLRAVLFCVALMTVVSCARDKVMSQSGEVEFVSLRATTSARGWNDTRAAVSADAYYETVPTADNPLLADVWFSTDQGVYEDLNETDKVNNRIHAHRQITYRDGSSTYPSPVGGTYLQYPENGSVPVWCVGFYPQGSWTLTSDDATKARAEVDGRKDLMYAVQISGKKDGADFLSSKAQLYRHMQTWIKVSVHADESISPEVWGKITKIEVKTRKGIIVTMDDETDGSPQYDAEEQWITAFEGAHEFNTTVEEIGSVFVTPVVGVDDGMGGSTATCTIRVTTEKITAQEVSIQMQDYSGEPYIGSTEGLLYVLIIDLKTPAIISGTATLVAWTDEERRMTLGEIPEIVLSDDAPGNTYTNADIALPESAVKVTVTADDSSVATASADASVSEHKANLEVTAVSAGKTRLTLRAYDSSDNLLQVMPYKVTVTGTETLEMDGSGSVLKLEGLMMPEGTTEVVASGDAVSGDATAAVEANCTAWASQSRTAALTLRAFSNAEDSQTRLVTLTAKKDGEVIYSRKYNVTVSPAQELTAELPAGERYILEGLEMPEGTTVVTVVADAVASGDAKPYTDAWTKFDDVSKTADLTATSFGEGNRGVTLLAWNGVTQIYSRHLTLTATAVEPEHLEFDYAATDGTPKSVIMPVPKVSETVAASEMGSASGIKFTDAVLVASGDAQAKVTITPRPINGQSDVLMTANYTYDGELKTYMRRVQVNIVNTKTLADITMGGSLEEVTLMPGSTKSAKVELTSSTLPDVVSSISISYILESHQTVLVIYSGTVAGEADITLTGYTEDSYGGDVNFRKVFHVKVVAP